MRMYAMTVEDSIPVRKLPSLILAVMRAMSLANINILCKDNAATPVECSLHIPKDSDRIRELLKMLTSDTAFFVLSCSGRALIIPFEGAHFNIVVADGECLPNISGLHVEDATEVLALYHDAYEAYGIEETFGPSA